MNSTLKIKNSILTLWDTKEVSSKTKGNILGKMYTLELTEKITGDTIRSIPANVITSIVYKYPACSIIQKCINGFREEREEKMNDYLRESFSYFGLYRRLLATKKYTSPESVRFGPDKEQYFLYYEPDKAISNKIIFWVHGGGWNAGNPKFFDYVGQHISKAGYRIISAGYRLSPKNKYPVQMEDVCSCYNRAIDFLKEKGIDTSQIIVVGPSAGAHLTSIMCYSEKTQKEYGVDISSIIGFVGFGGPYSFRKDQSKTIKLLLNQLFEKGYHREDAEPVSLMSQNHIPMLLIQSRHDGLIQYECAEDFALRARELGNKCELYSVEDKKNTHSWYTAGLFLETRAENKGLDKFFTWIEEQ